MAGYVVQQLGYRVAFLSLAAVAAAALAFFWACVAETNPALTTGQPAETAPTASPAVG